MSSLSCEAAVWGVGEISPWNGSWHWMQIPMILHENWMNWTLAYVWMTPQRFLHCFNEPNDFVDWTMTQLI